jgi:putative transposase
MTTSKFQNKYRIPSARAVWHDYNGGEYFITICTKNRECYFGKIKQGEIVLSEIGKYAVNNLEHINHHYPYCEIPLFVVMPNHIHAIVVIDKKTNGNNETNVEETMSSSSLQIPSTKTNEHWKNVSVNKKMQSISLRRGKLSTAMGGFKRAITSFSKEKNIDFYWQTRFHDYIIRDQQEMNNFAIYIENNPTTWENDTLYSVSKICKNSHKQTQPHTCVNIE